MRIVERRKDDTALVDLSGVRCEADLTLVESARVGDYVIVHAGYAIEILDIEEAEARLDLFEKLAHHNDPESASIESSEIEEPTP